MVDRNKLIKAAELLKNYCATIASDCNGCVFNHNKHLCALQYFPPAEWDFPKPRRFTDEDIALAKALKGIGVTGISQDSIGGLYCDGITDQRGGRFYLPKGVFRAVANELLVASIDEIIAEGEE